MKPDDAKIKSEKGQEETSLEPETLSQLAALRNNVDNTFKSLVAVVSAAARPLPKETGDGTYVKENPGELENIKNLVGDLSSLGIKDVATLLEVARKKASGEPTDDKTYLMEGIIAVRPR